LVMSLTGLRAVVWKGQPVVLRRSDDNESGYLNVCKGRTNSKGTTWYAKFTPVGEKGQRTLPQSSFKKPEDAAAELAYLYFLAGHRGPLGTKEARNPRRDAEEIALDRAEVKRVKLEKKEARRAALRGDKENTPRLRLPTALASPITGSEPMRPGVPLVSLMPVPPFNMPVEPMPVATVAPLAGSVVRM